MTTEKVEDSPKVNPETVTKPEEETKKPFLAFLKKRKEKKDSLSEEEKLANEPTIIFPIYLWWVIGFSWVWILLCCFFNGIAGAVPVLFQVIFGDITTIQSDPNPREKVNRLALNLLYVAIGAGLANGLANFFSGVAAATIGTSLKKKVYSSLLNQEIGYFDIRKAGILIKRISEDTKNIENAYGIKIGSLVQYVVQGIVGLSLAFKYTWLQTLGVLCFGPVIAVVMVVVGSGEGIFSKLASRISDKGTAKATEVISTMKTVRSMSGEDKEYDFFKKQFGFATKLTIIRSFFKFLGFFCMVSLIWGACAFAFWFGGRLIVYGIGGHKIGLDALLQSFGSLLMAIFGGVLMMTLIPDFSKSSQSTREVLKILKRKPALKYEGGEKIENLQGEIEFKNVDFYYPSRPTVQILKDFSLKIPVGKTTAFVGASGSGKSTITNLIEFFYDSQAGDITLDGVKIRDLDPSWLHEHIGIVTQEPTLFSGTIEDNIKYGLPPGRNVTKQQIIEAAIMANAHNFIMNFKDGYNTLLGESSGLSGGQKQRIAIARMCLLNPKIILQDESTSALDSESEKLVQDALNKLIQGRTAIVIAHRLSTIKDADQIVVMEKGKIVEIGSHSELLSKGPRGAYYKLAQKQVAFGHDSATDLFNLAKSQDDLNANEEINIEEVSSEQAQDEKSI